MPALGLGSTLPRIEGLKFIKGTPLDDIGSAPAGGRVLVLEFWATWCPPCRESIPHLTQLQARYRDRGVVIVGISSETESTVRPFVNQMDRKMDYHVAVDVRKSAQRELMQPLGVRGIPHAIVIDRHNRIVYSGHPMEQQFERKLEEAAAESITVKPPKVTQTREELAAMSTSALKAILAQHGVSLAGLAEKGDLVDKILEVCT